MSEASKSRLPIWLIVSLMANALLIGLLIGGGLGQHSAGPPAVRGGGEQALMRGIDQALPAEQRRELRRVFRCLACPLPVARLASASHGQNRFPPMPHWRQVNCAAQLSQGRAPLAPGRTRAREARRNLGRRCAADDYDAAEVQAGFAELREAESAMKANMHDLLAESLGELSTEQRRLVLRDLDRAENGRAGPRGPRQGPTRPDRQPN